MNLFSSWRTAEAQRVNGLDVIGDVHGQAAKLSQLLRHLGYRERRGAWRHPSRQVIFVGDLIDRGPEQQRTVDMARRMVDAGSAQCILGNHEFNAIAWYMEDPEAPGSYLRPRTSAANHQQHAAFLREVEGTAAHADLIAWFKTLPLWLEIGGLKVAHACWHAASMCTLRADMGPGNTLTDALIVAASRDGSAQFEALETICKGPHLKLPAGASFKDKDGRIRTEIRLKWWQQDLKTYRDAGVGPHAEMAQLPELPLAADVAWCRCTDAPVIFGHYWFTGDPRVISERLACVDFSAARHGPLVAYRYDGEPALSTAKLDWVATHAHPR